MISNRACCNSCRRGNVPLHDRSAKACDTACEMTTASDDRDMSAIGQTLRALQTAFQTRNADLLRDVYTAECGLDQRVRNDPVRRDAIVSYLRGLFADEHFAVGQLIGTPQVSVRAVTPDVVVVKTCVEIAGRQDGCRQDAADPPQSPPADQHR